MKTEKNRFHNSNGTLTMYSFACGYVEKYGKKDSHHGAAISREPNGWHVKGFDVNEKHFWEVFDTVRDARKFAKRVSK